MARIPKAAAAASVLLTAAASLAFLPPASRAARQDPGHFPQIVLTPEERALVLKGKIVLRVLRNPGREGRTFEAMGTLQGSIDEAVAVLTDFDGYPEFMPNVASVRLCEATGPCSVVEFKLHLPLGVKKQYRLKYTGTRDDSGFELAWEMLPWPELKPSQTIADSSGTWLVRRVEDVGLVLFYHSYTDPGHVPLGLKGLALSIAKSKVPDVIARVRARILEVYGPGRKGASASEFLSVPPGRA